MLIAEPWDIGPGGYQLGNFPAPWLEWNDRYRDRVRRFWRGDAHMLGDFATALAGSSDVFAPPATRSVNFIAAHDGFTLADLVAYRHKHNEANGEDNRDGHGENLSWNNGVEGADRRPRRARRARTATCARCSPRSSPPAARSCSPPATSSAARQRGNNNAYAQDNPITWLDWDGRDRELEACTAELAALRRAHPALADPALLTGAADAATASPTSPGSRPAATPRPPPTGRPPAARRWRCCSAAAETDVSRSSSTGARTRSTFHLPAAQGPPLAKAARGRLTLGPRSVAFVAEAAGGPPGGPAPLRRPLRPQPAP